MSDKDEVQEQPKYTQAEVDELLEQAAGRETYKYACYEALRAMVSFNSPPYLREVFVVNNPEAFPPAPKEEKKSE